MSCLDRLEDSILPLVSKPSRYLAPLVGGGPETPEWEKSGICLVSPRSWDDSAGKPGMASFWDSFLRLRTPLRAGEDLGMDVCFTPEEDLQAHLEDRSLPWFGLSSRLPLSRFPVIIGYLRSPGERPAFLQVLERGGIPVPRQDRSQGDPVVLVAGDAAHDPSRFRDVADGCLSGDPEAYSEEIVGWIQKSRKDGWDRRTWLFHVEGLEDGPRWLTRLPAVPLRVLAPHGSEGELAVVEIARPRGPAGISTSEGSVRFRSVEDTVRECEALIAATGCGDLILAGAEHYPKLIPLLEGLNQRLSPHRVTIRPDAVDLSSLRPSLARELSKGRRVDLNLAPTLVSARLREASGRALSGEGFVEAAATALKGGWRVIRFRMILGAPGETEEDRREGLAVLKEIAALPVKKANPPRLSLEIVPYSSDAITTVSAWQERLPRNRIKTVVTDPEEAVGPAVQAEGTLVELHPSLRPDPGRGFAIPAWNGGRRPKRSGRGKERKAERFRLRYSKDERLRFVSHLDVTRAFSRAFRRSQLPVAVSNGKDRRLRVSFGPPLPLGMTSGAEYVDLTFVREVPESFVKTLNETLPEGLAVIGCAPIRTEAASLNSAVQLAVYEVSFSDTVITRFMNGIDFDELKTDLETRLDRVLTSDSFPVVKIRGEETRTYNARPSLKRAQVVRDDGGRPVLELALTMNQPNSVRPELFTTTLVETDLDERLLRVHRRRLYVPGRDSDLDPLDVVAPGFAWWRQPVQGRTVP